MDGIREALPGVQDVLETLSRELEPQNGRFLSAVTWPFKSENIERMLTKLLAISSR